MLRSVTRCSQWRGSGDDLRRTHEGRTSCSMAKRKAEKAEYRRQLELVCEVRRLALDAVKEEIRARGDKVQLYSRGSLQAMADESISPFLKAQVSLKRMQRRGINRELPVLPQHEPPQAKSRSALRMWTTAKAVATPWATTA